MALNANHTSCKCDKFSTKSFHKTTKCHFCAQNIAVKTIDDMLKRAYTTMSSNDKLMSFFKNTKQSKESVGICQNHSRLADFFAEEFEKVYFANLDSKFIGTYRSIANRQSAIKFCFSEDFSALEQVEVGILKLKETEQMCFMREFFACFVDFAGALDECVEPNKHLTGKFLVLKKDGKAVKDNEFSAIYPDRNNQHFVFERGEKNSKIINKVLLRLTRCKELDEPLSLWLNQKIIHIIPDFSCYLWDNAHRGIDLSCLKGYENLYESELGKAFEAWGDELDAGALDENFDWQAFNKKGLKLWRELQEQIKDRYIVLYEKEF